MTSEENQAQQEERQQQEAELKVFTGVPNLRDIDVWDEVEKKGKFNYLSWANAVDYLIQACPSATWEFREWDGIPYKITDQGVFVCCTVTVNNIPRTQWHPVLDNRNKPIKNPDVFAINTSQQRCLAKAIALHGLGLKLFKGEDLPQTSYTEEERLQFVEYYKNGDALEIYILEQTDRAKYTDLYNHFPKNKTDHKKKLDELEAEGQQIYAAMVNDTINALKEGNNDYLFDLKELSNEAKKKLMTELSSDEQKQIIGLLKEAA